MAISPIAIATQGTLNSPLSVAAVRGHLTIQTQVEVPKPGGPFNAPGRWAHPQLELDRLQVQAEREDEEIISILATFIEIVGDK